MRGAAAGAAALLLTVLLWPVRVVTVTLIPAGAARPRVALEVPLRAPLPLRVTYVHSVERTPVVEHYEAGRPGLRLVGMTFAAQGAGLPSSGYTTEDGRFQLRADRALPRLAIRVSAAAPPHLTLGGTTLDLLRLVGDGGSVIVEVRWRPWWRLRPVVYG